MLVGFMNDLQPDKADDNPESAHKEEHVRPAHLMGQPTHDWRKNNGGKVLRGVKDSHRGAPLLRREPRRDDTAVSGERWRFGQADKETQGKQRDDNAEAAEDIDEALQQGKHGPDKNGPEVDAF